MMKKLFYGLVAIACLYASAAIAAEETSDRLRVLYTAQSSYQESEIDLIAGTFSELTGTTMEINYVAYADQYQHLQESIADYDVVSLDQVWLTDLASKNLLAPLNSYQTRAIRDDITPEVLSAFRVQKELLAFPSLLNFQLFFYNQTMLEEAGFSAAPKTLEELLEQMVALKEQGIVQYPWTDAWRQSEGLLCDYVWLSGAFGGQLFTQDGEPVFDTGAGLKALEFMRLLIDKQLTNPDILLNDELTAKDQFLAREAVFTSNWVFMQGFIERADSGVQTEGKVALLPVVGGNSKNTVSVSAFQGIGITATAENKDLAWQWIKFFTSPLVQRAYLYEMPIWTSVQTSDDAKLFLSGQDIKRAQLKSVQQRPMLENYSQISTILQRHLYAALEGSVLPADALQQAKAEIQPLLKSPDEATTN